MKMRKEVDSMGEMEVPQEALYGATTQRAVLNFPISKLRFSRDFIGALGAIKFSAAQANKSLQLLAADKADAISEAAKQVMDGELDSHFVLDIFQTGSGTSTNMNANEVIANRAIQILGGKPGDKSVVHPNDHVNMCQSSNDVIPTAIHVSASIMLTRLLIPALEKLQNTFQEKAKRFAGVVKSGRTHLQDATPVTLGQEFSGYGRQIELAIQRVKGCFPTLTELALGGTAVGTGLNTHPEFAQRAISELNKLTGMSFTEAQNHFEAQASRDAAVEMSGQLRTVAISMLKIANDVRFLSSGPRCGLGEISFPDIQPGSSIMPAKVNPVICESTMMVAAQVIGNDACIATCGQHGNFELNVMMPVIAHNLLESIEILAAAVNNFNVKCASGIEADVERCLDYAEKSLATCTSLAPKIGYDQAAKVAKKAYAENKTVRQVARELNLLSEEELAKVLDLVAMTKPGL
ncbi:MAG: class II fumarate hydratase [Deltaproteobacteria bacterium]|nr:class II fumarate hydratase [Deltaproteobacteria bacterium]